MKQTPANHSVQYEIDFEPGLIEQFSEFGDCVRASVYSCGKQLKSVAADLDLSASMLSRMLNTNDPSVNFPQHRMAELIRATGDLRPVFWLIETFCQDDDARRTQAVRELARLVPMLNSAMERAGLNDEPEPT